MTALRFGTDTGCFVHWRLGLLTASVGDRLTTSDRLSRGSLFRKGQIPPRVRRDAGVFEENSVSASKRTRWETSRGLGWLFGVAPRSDRRHPEAPRHGFALTF
jgi:hypothetical protein